MERETRLAEKLRRVTSLAAERQRRHRERRQRGCRVIAVEVDDDLLEFLEQLGLVDQAEAADSGALSFGLWMLLNEISEKHRSRIKESLSRVTERLGAGVESPD